MFEEFPGVCVIVGLLIVFLTILGKEDLVGGGFSLLANITNGESKVDLSIASISECRSRSLALQEAALLLTTSDVEDREKWLQRTKTAS